MALSLDEIKSILAEMEIASASHVDELLEKLPASARPSDDESLLTFLIERRILTSYQAQVILRGKGRSLRLGKYLIEDKLGQGGMGMVYRARHVKMKREIALKVVSAKVSKIPELMLRFHREVEAAAKLHHPNIVVAHDAAEDNGTSYLVMEFIDGKDLAAIVKKKGPLTVSQAVNLIRQAAVGLEYAHSQGVIHRDIKPSNLLLDRTGTVKILDMGLARIEDEAGAAELTATGAVMGTVDYMAPEQAISTKHATSQSDIYSLGCSLWYLLVGRPIYGGESMMAKLLSHRSEPTPSLIEERHDVPDELQAIFDKMVAKKPENRYSSMTEVVADLEKFQSGDANLTAMNAAFSSDDDQLGDYLQDPGATLPGSGGTAVSNQTRRAGSRTLQSMVDTDTMHDFQSFMLPPVATGASPRSRRQPTRPQWWENWKLWASVAGGIALIVILSLVFGRGTKPTSPELANQESPPETSAPTVPSLDAEQEQYASLPPAITVEPPALTTVTREQLADTLLKPGSVTDGNLSQEVFQFLIDKPELTDWKPLTILETQSERGAILTAQPDGSVLVTGENIPGEMYELVVTSAEPAIYAIRLEALPHSSLPHNGPGRHESGNFQISSFELYRGRPDQRVFEDRIAFSEALTDYELPADNVDVESIIDDDRPQVWHVWARFGVPHLAVLIPSEPVQLKPGEELTIRIQHIPGNDDVNLGCFRLTTASAPVSARNEKLLLALRQNAFDQTLSACVAFLIKGSPAQAQSYLDKNQSLSPDDPRYGDQLLLQALTALDAGNTAAAELAETQLAQWMQTHGFEITPLKSLALDVLSKIGKQDRQSARRVIAYHQLHTDVEGLQAALEKEAVPPIHIYFYLARRLSQLRQWKEAADVDLESLKHYPNDRYQWMRAAGHLLMAGDEERYQDLCDDLVKELGKSSDPFVADVVCKVCLLKPKAVPLSRLPSRVLKQRLAEQDELWFRATMALGAYREKKYRDSLKLLQDIQDTPSPELNALVFVLRALAQFESDDKQSAIESYHDAAKLIPPQLRTQASTGDVSIDYLDAQHVDHDWLIAEILRREAEELIFDTKSSLQ